MHVNKRVSPIFFVGNVWNISYSKKLLRHCQIETTLHNFRSVSLFDRETRPLVNFPIQGTPPPNRKRFLSSFYRLPSSKGRLYLGETFTFPKVFLKEVTRRQFREVLVSQSPHFSPRFIFYSVLIITLIYSYLLCYSLLERKRRFIPHSFSHILVLIR